VPQDDAEPGFTFVDRRRRADDAPARPEPSVPQAASPAPPRPGPDAPGEPAGIPLRADLSSLCMMLSTDALVQLGQVPDPVTGRSAANLDQARFLIDLLAMLHAKTEGNRRPEETALLDEILATLRLAFVRVSRSS
jgi:hypothetical protein